MDKIIHCACIQHAFSAYRTQLTGKQRATFEITLNFGLEETSICNIYFVFVPDFCLGRVWKCKRAGAHIHTYECRTLKQTVLCILLSIT